MSYNENAFLKGPAWPSALLLLGAQDVTLH